MPRTSEVSGESRRRLLEHIAADAAARWGDDTEDPSETLYDERGLPR